MAWPNFMPSIDHVIRKYYATKIWNYKVYSLGTPECSIKVSDCSIKEYRSFVAVDDITDSE